MKAINRLGAAVVFAAALSAMLPATALADMIYSYTGNDFTFADPPYTTSDSISGFFTLPSALAPSTTFPTITPTAFSFSDGQQTLSSSLATASIVIVNVTTNASGNISQWQLAVLNLISGTQNTQLITCNTPSNDCFALANLDKTFNFNTGNVIEAYNMADPGVWSVSEIPIPAALPLFASGLGVLGLLAYRKRRKALAA
jgi:hypothetical protein